MQANFHSTQGSLRLPGGPQPGSRNSYLHRYHRRRNLLLLASSPTEDLGNFLPFALQYSLPSFKTSLLVIRNVAASHVPPFTGEVSTSPDFYNPSFESVTRPSVQI